MASNETQIHSKADSWAELANKVPAPKPGTGAGAAVKRLVSDMNSAFPLANATGIFDLGTGAGSVISHVLDTYATEIPANATLLAGDYSTHMMQKLRDNKDAKAKDGSDAGRVWGRLKIEILDAHDLNGIEDGSMSHVTAGHVLMLLENPRKALSEIHRVLAPNGVLAFSTGKSSQHITALQSAFHTIKPDAPKLELLRPPYNNADDIKTELEQAGFTGVRSDMVDMELGYTSHQEFADAMMVMPVMKNQLEEGWNEEEKKRLNGRIVEEFRNANADEPGVVKGVNIVTIARKRT